MCSESTRRLALPLLVVLTLAACGKQGDPTPPPRLMPQQTKDLAATQRGDQVLIGFSYPATTISGLPLAGLDSLTVYEILRPLPPPPAPPATSATPATPAPSTATTAAPTAPAAAAATATPAPAATPPAAPTPAPTPPTPTPSPAAATPPSVATPAAPAGATATSPASATATTPAAPKPPVEKVDYTDSDYKKLARPVLTLTGKDIDSGLVGGKFRLRVPLPATATTDGQERIYVVRTRAKGGEPSPWSNAVILVPRSAPPAPSELSVTATSTGVSLHWSAPAGIAGLAVLRRESSNPEWGEPLAVLPADAVDYLDRAAVLGTRYVYTVISRSASTPPAESAPSGEREVDYRDVFAPAAPTSLRALGMAGEVRLVWEASPDNDVAGYFVERAAGDGEFVRLTPQPIDALEYSDAGAPAGTQLTYRVVAVDRAGNLSEPSDVTRSQGPLR